MTLDDLASASPPKPKNKIGQRAVVDGVLQSVSPSQIKTFQACPRSWWFDKVAGLKPEEEAEHFAVGTALHKQQEDWYEFGKKPDNESCRYVLTLPGVPDRDSIRVVIEEPANYDLGLMAAGVPMRGKLDLLKPPEGETFGVLDWKSCKNYRFIKSPEELERDIQGIVYLKYGFQKFEQTKYGTFTHVYIRTDSVGGKVVSTEPLDRIHVDSVYAEIEKSVERIKIAAGKKEQDEVEFDKTACFAYGGCPYQRNCNAFRTKKEEPKKMDNGFFARMRAAQTKNQSVNDVADSDNAKANERMTNEAAMNKASEKAIVEAMAAPSIVPPDAPESKKMEPGPEVKKIMEDIVKIEEKGMNNPCKEVNVSSAVNLILCIDCIPVNPSSRCIVLEESISEITPEIVQKCRDLGVQNIPENCNDVRLVPFGQGTAQLISHFKTNPPRGLVLASSNGLSGQVAEALIPMAYYIYRGVR